MSEIQESKRKKKNRNKKVNQNTDKRLQPSIKYVNSETISINRTKDNIGSESNDSQTANTMFHETSSFQQEKTKMIELQDFSGKLWTPEDFKIAYGAMLDHK